MAGEKEISIKYQEFDSLDAFSPLQQKLIEKTRFITKQAYAPYSQFYVGSGLLVSDHQIILGTNVENASSPIGTCAEKNVIAQFMSNRSDRKIHTIAIHAINAKSNTPQLVSPCGMCRQTILEAELFQNQKIAIILIDANNRFVMVNSARDLLPLAFTPDSL